MSGGFFGDLFDLNGDGKLVDGDKDEYMEVPYILSFIRKKGVKYDQSTPIDNCPHCGKKLKVNEDGYCLECDVDIDTKLSSCHLFDVLPSNFL